MILELTKYITELQMLQLPERLYQHIIMRLSDLLQLLTFLNADC